MPPNIDMSAIRDAIARRAAGGGGTPAIQQVSNPMGQTPLQPPPQVAPTGPLTNGPPPAPEGAPPQGAPQGQPQPAAAGGQGGGSDPFDGETKATAKALIARLMKVL